MTHSTPASLLAASALTLVVTGCASTPVPNAALENARTAVQTTEANPNVAKYAPLDLQTAKKDLADAESASLHHDEIAVNQSAYLAAQTARLAQFKAAAKADDARVAAGKDERAQIELAARNREIAKANSTSQEAAAKSAALKAELEALKAKQNQ